MQLVLFSLFFPLSLIPAVVFLDLLYTTYILRLFEYQITILSFSMRRSLCLIPFPFWWSATCIWYHIDYLSVRGCRPLRATCSRFDRIVSFFGEWWLATAMCLVKVNTNSGFLQLKWDYTDWTQGSQCVSQLTAINAWHSKFPCNAHPNAYNNTPWIRYNAVGSTPIRKQSHTPNHPITQSSFFFRKGLEFKPAVATFSPLSSHLSTNQPPAASGSPPHASSMLPASVPGCGYYC